MTIATRDNSAKTLGAYYTDGAVASFLVRWAIRQPHETVMDPSFGAGVFLRAACDRISQLGGNCHDQVAGVELNPEAYQRALLDISRDYTIDKNLFERGDFFGLEPGYRKCDAVVGNPPFIRYHRFTGEMRKRALVRAASEGVRLSELSSSWAPFLIHAASMVKEGGRLAMVLPFELTYAVYARPVLLYLANAFGRITILSFRKKIFRDLNEDTVLMLADLKGAPSNGLVWRNMDDVTDLTGLELLGSSYGAVNIEHDALCRGEERVAEHIVPFNVRELYRRLKAHPKVRNLGILAKVGIGYVTGDNGYFHLDQQAVNLWSVPETFLRPSVWRGRALVGLNFTQSDWHRGLRSGDAGYLLHIPADAAIPKCLRAYLQEGERKGVHLRYKCKVRSPWYSVPHVVCPDALLTYMSGNMPKLVANTAAVAAPNTLHVVRLRTKRDFSARELAVLWQNSLTRLSTEIEGHALGGGMLKLEPAEARRILVPLVHGMAMRVLAGDLDELYRKEGPDSVMNRCDEIVLRRTLGLSKAECQALRTGTDVLFNRRYAKSGI